MRASSPILYRAGALTAIHIPTEQEEAARDLLRCREDIRADLLRARHRLSKFLLRHGRRFTGTKKAWSQAARRPGSARRRGRCPRSIRRTRAYLRAVDEAVARLRAVEEDLRALLDARAAAPARRAAALFPRHRRSHRADHRRRTRRPAPLRHGAAHDGVCRPGAVRAFQRDETGARRDHQNRECPSAPRPGRSRLALSPSALCRRRAAPPATRRAGRPSSRRPGPRSSACIVAITASPRAGNRTNTSSPRSPANSPASSGRP